MLELLTKFSVSEILIFIVMLAIAFKAIISFIDWGKQRLHKMFHTESQKQRHQRETMQKIQNCEKSIDKISNEQKSIIKSIDKLADKIDMLVQSDKEDIKSFLTKEHHYFCYQRGWIDDYSLECCERRYEYYVKEGGNTFICGFMKDLRNLPKVPPQTHATAT